MTGALMMMVGAALPWIKPDGCTAGPSLACEKPRHAIVADPAVVCI